MERSSDITVAKPFPYLPDDILKHQILSRLPVKILVKFSCVCKSWQNLISEPEFITSHLQNQPPGGKFLTIGRKHRRRGLFRRFFPGSPISFFNGCDYETIMKKRIFKTAPGLILLGSHRGVFCFSKKTRHSYPLEPEIYLWNPALRQCTLLPPLLNNVNNSCFDDQEKDQIELFELKHGFGFDCVSNDYKVAKWGFFFPKNNNRLGQNSLSWRLDVYSLRNHSWKTLCSESKSDPYYYLNDFNPSSNSNEIVVHNGCLYWLHLQDPGGDQAGHKCLVLNQVRLQEVEESAEPSSSYARTKKFWLPDYVTIHPPSCLRHGLVVVNGHLALFGVVQVQSQMDQFRIELRRMNMEVSGSGSDSGSGCLPSWTKQFVICTPGYYDNSNFRFHFSHFTSNGKFLAYMYHQNNEAIYGNTSPMVGWLLVYDPETQSFDDYLEEYFIVDIRSELYYLNIVDYMESLVSVLPPKQQLASSSLVTTKVTSFFQGTIKSCFQGRQGQMQNLNFAGAELQQ